MEKFVGSWRIVSGQKIWTSDKIVWGNYGFKEYDECVNFIRPIIE